MGSYLSSLFWQGEPDDDDEGTKDNKAAPPPPRINLDVLPLVPTRRFQHQSSLPLNVQNEAADLVERMVHADLGLAEDNIRVLQVQLPGKRYKRALQRWPLVADPARIAHELRTLMQEDGLSAIRSAPEVCARYPGYFWNLVFYCQKDTGKLYEFIRAELAE